MKITDAAVYPFPLGDASVRRLALEAAALGFDSIVAADTPSGTYAGVEVHSGLMIRDVPVKDVITAVKRSKDSGKVVSVNAANNNPVLRVLIVLAPNEKTSTNSKGGGEGLALTKQVRPISERLDELALRSREVATPLRDYLF